MKACAVRRAPSSIICLQSAGPALHLNWWHPACNDPLAMRFVARRRRMFNAIWL
jgi:hypothetical protein